MAVDFDKLQRPRQPMPDFVRAKRAATREKRLRQMLDELAQGGVYMKIDHPASRKGQEGHGPYPDSRTGC